MDELQTQEWYEALVEECKAIITERVRNSREELIVGYGEVGQRIHNDPGYQKNIHGNRTFVNRLFNDIGIGESTGYYCLQFYEKFIHNKHDEVSTAMESLFPEDGKNISWTKIKTKYLPEPKENKIGIPLPSGKYDVIYADPPWQYSNNRISGAAENHYSTMTIEQLSELKIPSADNSVLFMWVTNPLLAESMPLIAAWGFEYKTNIVWVKNIAGQGFYVKGQHELLLICTKGSMRPKDNLYVRSVVKLPRQEHSQKPVRFYEIIEELYPNGKYLELFARNKRDGWNSWGNEI